MLKVRLESRLNQHGNTVLVAGNIAENMCRLLYNYPIANIECIKDQWYAVATLEESTLAFLMQCRIAYESRCVDDCLLRVSLERVCKYMLNHTLQKAIA